MNFSGFRTDPRHKEVAAGAANKGNRGNYRISLQYDKVALRVLNQIGRLSGQLQISTAETSFGMRFTKFESYKGTVNLIEHPLMNGLQRSGMMLVMDMAALKLAAATAERRRGADAG